MFCKTALVKEAILTYSMKKVNSMAKTNAIRMVEQAGIPYREAFYSSDTYDWNGLHAAQAIGFPTEQVFKILVARGER